MGSRLGRWNSFVISATLPAQPPVCKRDRMLASAINFTLGFFGWPLDGKYEQVITIEASGVGFDILHRGRVI